MHEHAPGALARAASQRRAQRAAARARDRRRATSARARAPAPGAAPPSSAQHLVGRRAAAPGSRASSRSHSAPARSAASGATQVGGGGRHGCLAASTLAAGRRTAAAPVSASYSMTPTRTSRWPRSAARPAACSGAMYAGVPTHLAALVGARRAAARASATRPKSSTTTRPAAVTSTLDGLMSRCSMPGGVQRAHAPRQLGNAVAQARERGRVGQRRRGVAPARGAATAARGGRSRRRRAAPARSTRSPWAGRLVVALDASTRVGRGPRRAGPALDQLHGEKPRLASASSSYSVTRLGWPTSASARNSCLNRYRLSGSTLRSSLSATTRRARGRAPGIRRPCRPSRSRARAYRPPRSPRRSRQHLTRW